MSDPTDHALATIASILDQPETPRVVDTPRPAEKPDVEDVAPTIVPSDGDGYFKVGPGPMEAIRFKWTVRRTDDGDYFVDETIGDSSALTSPARCGRTKRSSSSMIASARRASVMSSCGPK